MKIYVKNKDGKVYEAFQIDENNYTFRMEHKVYEVSLIESSVNDFALSKKQTRQYFQMTTFWSS